MPSKQERESSDDEIRRWRIPPPLLRDADSPGPEGLSILEEIRSEVGVILWKSLRSTLLWAEVEPEERKGLFDSEASQRRQQEIERSIPAAKADLRRDLTALIPAVESPAEADGEAMAEACERIATWAESSGCPRTALEFLQAGSLCAPRDASLALDVGYAVRELGQPARAESWFQRALGLARQTNDWEPYVLAYLAHGRVMMERGAFPAARESYIKAVRRAGRQNMREMEVEVFHDLFLLESRAGNHGQALSAARETLDVLDPDDDQFPELARDLGIFWLKIGQFEHAFELLREAAKRIQGDARGKALGAAARAAGQVGDRETFDWARQELDRWWDGPGAPEAWADVARGAAALKLKDVTRQAADRAESSARTRDDEPGDFAADALLETIETETKALEAVAAQAQLLDDEQQRIHDVLAERVMSNFDARSDD